MGVTSNSYADNSDGDGFYSGDLLVKGKDKINLLSFHEVITNSKVNICHQRLATSGLTPRYIQPFNDRDFVLVHNGVINEFLGKKGSDTYGFFRKFIKKFEKSKGKSREERIIKTIKELLDNLTYGSYSIALFDKVSENLYYFKNYSTNIHFYKSSEMLYITTNSCNNMFLKMFDYNFSELDIKEDIIYKITTANKIKVCSVGKIEEKKVTTILFTNNKKKKKNKKKKNNYYNENLWRNNFIDTAKKTFKEEEKEREIIDEVMVMNDLGNCAECGNQTYNLNPFHFERICDDCLKEHKKPYNHIGDTYLNNYYPDYV